MAAFALALMFGKYFSAFGLGLFMLAVLFDMIDVLAFYLPICGRCKRVFSNSQWLTLHQMVHRMAGNPTFNATCPDCEEHLPAR